MAEFGTITLQILLLLATWAGSLALVGARRRSRSMIDAARLATTVTALLASVAMVILAYAFMTSDFSLTYVHRYSERAMPTFYKLTAIWGGQEGSLLLWAWLLAVMAAWAVHTNRERLRELIPYAIVVLMATLVFFCLLLLVSANPFSTFLTTKVVEGRGLNPLLQNAYMVTHPPALYIGYVGMAIPFAFAMAALLTGRTDESWIVACRPWALASWYFLALGLVLGMLWAYEELGWGGYWAWDPVENAGLIPWLTSTAYIHSAMIQERRGMLKVWNVVLAILTFVLTIFGTFLTRSGFIQSVHAFAQSSIGYYFLAFMILVLLVATLLIIWRRDLLRSRGELESVVSREFSFVVNNWILLSAAFLVMVLTIFPTLSVLFGNKITISAPAFNRWMIPIGLALLFLKAAGPMVGWRKSTSTGLRRQFLGPLAFTAAVVAGLLGLGVRGALPLTTFALCTFVLGTVVLETARGVAVRRRATGVDPLTALAGLFSRNRRRYGGYLAHVGVALIFIGFGGEAYKLESEVQLRPGQRAPIGPYVLRYDETVISRDEQKEMTTSTLSLFVGMNPLGKLQPARWVYFKHENQPTTEVDIRRTVMEDLFVILGSHDPATGAATFKLIINPLVTWIWVGFVLLSLGTGVALWPVAVRRVRRVAAGAAATAALLGLLLAAGAVAWAEGQAPPVGPGEKTLPVKITSETERGLFAKLACMCPTCPRTPLATCQCEFASRERDAIRQRLNGGWDEARVLSWYLAERGKELGRPPFGAEALTTPPDTGWNRLSWLVPYATTIVAAVVLLLAGRRWARAAKRAAPTAVAPAIGGATGSTASTGAGTSADAAAARAGPAAAADTASDETQRAYEKLLERELKKMD